MTSCALVVYIDKDDKLFSCGTKMTGCSLVVYNDKDDKLYSCSL